MDVWESSSRLKVTASYALHPHASMSNIAMYLAGLARGQEPWTSGSPAAASRPRQACLRAISAPGPSGDGPQLLLHPACGGSCAHPSLPPTRGPRHPTRCTARRVSKHTWHHCAGSEPAHSRDVRGDGSQSRMRLILCTAMPASDRGLLLCDTLRRSPDVSGKPYLRFFMHHRCMSL